MKFLASRAPPTPEVLLASGFPSGTQAPVRPAGRSSFHLPFGVAPHMPCGSVTSPSTFCLSSGPAPPLSAESPLIPIHFTICLASPLDSRSPCFLGANKPFMKPSSRAVWEIWRKA